MRFRVRTASAAGALVVWALASCATPQTDRLLVEKATLDALRPILSNPETEKVGQNVKYDMLTLDRAGITVGGPVTDTMVLSYLLESGERNHNLDQLSQRLLDHAMMPITDT